MSLWFSPADAAMRLRVRRQGMALLSYLMFLLPLMFAVSNGWMQFSWPGVILAVGGSLAINALFFLVIRSGYSARFQDPSLTLPQIVMSVVMALTLVRYANEARPVFLALFFASFFFGVFGLSRLQYWRLAGWTILGYALVVGGEMWMSPPPAQQAKLELLQFLVLAVILCWLAFVGGYVANLRQTLASQKAKLNEMVERLRKLVSHDELTGVFNRRQLLEVLERERACADRHEYAFCVCLLDIDHFKQINDTHGHATGDEVLREFSARMRQNARKMDWLGRTVRPDTDTDTKVSVGRYGGEEFMIVMPHTTANAARLGVERLREAIQALPVHTPQGSLDVRFSAGIAQYVAGESVDACIARADKALYRAKRLGRNRTEVASDEQVEVYPVRPRPPTSLSP